MSEFRVITNNVPRDVLYPWDLTADEKAEFDYLPWEDIDNGEASAEFFRYRGVVYDLGEFQTTWGMPDDSPLRQWDGYLSDSFFSAVVVRYVDDFERVVVGLALS